jgi:hypothetical protein
MSSNGSIPPIQLTEAQIAALLPLLGRLQNVERESQTLQRQVALIIESWDPPEGWALNQQDMTLEVRDLLEVAASVRSQKT